MILLLFYLGDESMKAQWCYASVIAFLFAISTAYSDRTQYDPTKSQFALPLLVDNEIFQPIVIDGLINQSRNQPESEPWEAAYRWTVQPREDTTDGVSRGHMAYGDVPESAEDLSFTVFIGFDEENLYIGVSVSDFDNYDDSAGLESYNTGNTWDDDSVEIFIDGDNSNYPERDTSGTNPEVSGTGGQYVITFGNAARDAEAGSPGYGPDAAWYARTEFTDVGYDAEFRISLDEIGNPQPGDIIGFSVAVNDDDDGDTSECQMIWAGETHIEASYGNLVFGGRSITAPKVNTAPTVDGNINSTEYPGAVEQIVDQYSGILSTGDDVWVAGDLEMSAWVVHDDDYIYVAVDVTDDVVANDTIFTPGTLGGRTWDDDGIEIYFDSDETNRHNYFGPAHLPRHEGNYNTTANNSIGVPPTNPVYGDNPDADFFSLTTLTDKGYQLEYKIKKLALTIPGEDVLMDTFGFNFSANDDDEIDPDGTEADKSALAGQYHWNGTANSERTYGFLTLSPEAASSVHEWSLY